MSSGKPPTSDADGKSSTRVSSRQRKPPNTAFEDEGRPSSSRGENIPLALPKIPWDRFPQSKHEHLISKPGQPFHGQYLLSENLPEHFDSDAFYDESLPRRWINVCASHKKPSQETKNPYKPECKTFQILISSAWLSKCARFYLWPSKQFVFEEDESSHSHHWIPNKTFVEYQAFPKKADEFLFSNPAVWDSVLEKLRRASRDHRDISSSDDSKSKHKNKNSPVKLEPLKFPFKEMDWKDNRKKRAELNKVPKKTSKSKGGATDGHQHETKEAADGQETVHEDEISDKSSDGKTRKAQKSPSPANEGKHIFID